MSNHVHMIISRNDISDLTGLIRDIKKYTSVQIIGAVKKNRRESRRELLVWLFERAGKYNPNNEHYQFCSSTVIRSSLLRRRWLISGWIIFIIILWKRDWWYHRSIICIAVRWTMLSCRRNWLMLSLYKCGKSEDCLVLGPRVRRACWRTTLGRVNRMIVTFDRFADKNTFLIIFAWSFTYFRSDIDQTEMKTRMIGQ